MKLNMTFHPFHLVEKRPWPLLISWRIFLIIINTIFLIHSSFNIYFFFTCFLLNLIIIYQWWRDISREATFQGYHTLIVKKGIKIGIIIFIIREIIFFFSLFWRYFHISLSPDIEIGITWPPTYINIINPFRIPLLNTTILLSSGITVTWAHHRLLNKNYSNRFLSLSLTILLGIYFTILQFSEYISAPFSFSDSVYGSTFFILTGFHGLHVIIGTLFLLINLLRINIGHFRNNHHFRFEGASWYWHFVDIVWLFLFIFIYWWPINYLISIKSTFNFQLKSFKNKIILFIFTFLLSLIILIINFLLRKLRFFDKEKTSPFECGFDPYIISRTPFSLQFFKISIIFIIFDIEIILILPIIFSINSFNLYIFFSTLFILLFILLGLFFEWYQGSLNWIN